MVAPQPELERILSAEYSAGFSSDIDSDTIAPGLSEAVIREISARKGEPDWLLDFRLAAFEKFQNMSLPSWHALTLPELDFQKISYFSAPKRAAAKSLAEVDPEILRTFDRLGIPLAEQEKLAGVAVDAVLDSVSISPSFRQELAELGIIFCSISEAVREHPDLVRRYLGSVVPPADNFFAALNSAVFSDGSFAFIPPGVRCPLELSTYFRINAVGTGQFERTLVIAEKGSFVSYLEGCTAPRRDENQLHAAVVELVALDDAEIRYATVQNWFPGDADGRGGILNFVTKRGVAGARARLSWTQVEVGSAITWKYPSCVLRGDDSVGEFYSVAVTRGAQQADTGTKMLHLGRRTKSRIISKGISAGRSKNIYRGAVDIRASADFAANKSQCDSLILSPDSAVLTLPYLSNASESGTIEHEASTSRIAENQLNYCAARGINPDAATGLIVHGFAREVMQRLPLEFAAEAKALLELSLEGSVG